MEGVGEPCQSVISRLSQQQQGLGGSEVAVEVVGVVVPGGGLKIAYLVPFYKRRN